MSLENYSDKLLLRHRQNYVQWIGRNYKSVFSAMRSGSSTYSAITGMECNSRILRDEIYPEMRRRGLLDE